jgi:hypothetical protein
VIGYPSPCGQDVGRVLPLCPHQVTVSLDEASERAVVVRRKARQRALRDRLRVLDRTADGAGPAQLAQPDQPAQIAIPSK